MHVRNEQLDYTLIKKIMSRTRYSRMDVLIKVPKMQVGLICCKCGSIVLNLDYHIRKVHKYERDETEYSEIMHNPGTNERNPHYQSNDAMNYNPLFSNTLAKSMLKPNLVSKVIDLASSTSEDTTNLIPQAFDFPIEDDDNLLDSTNVFSVERLKKDISLSLVRSIRSFEQFLSTNWGGSISKKGIAMDIANLCRIVNEVGGRYILNPNSLNKFFTQESNSGITPITTHSRLRSLHRFLDYLKITHSEQLPNEHTIKRLDSLMSGVEKSLLRKSKKQMTVVMSDNRSIYHHSVRVLEQWRNFRTTKHQLLLIEEFRLNNEMELTQDIYEKMRNYLICELIISNGQLAGVISGIIIKEVEDSKLKTTCDRHHKIIVSDHKTGSIHSATLFVYANVYQALSLFIQSVLANLPIYHSTPSLLKYTSCVFQNMVAKIF